MKPFSLTEDFIHADFSAVFYECSIPLYCFLLI